MIFDSEREENQDGNRNQADRPFTSGNKSRLKGMVKKIGRSDLLKATSNVSSFSKQKLKERTYTKNELCSKTTNTNGYESSTARASKLQKINVIRKEKTNFIKT